MAYVSIPVDVSGEIATHAALSQNVHGVAANDVVGADEIVGHKKSSSGNYSGNNTVNKACAHGLGSIPEMVLLFSAVWGYSGMIVNGSAYVSDMNGNLSVVTAMDATNFYVGNATNYDTSMNSNIRTYYWKAFL